MRGKPLNTPLPSPERERELDEMIVKGHYRQRLDIALRRRQQEPMASQLLREHILDMIKPNFKL